MILKRLLLIALLASTASLRGADASGHKLKIVLIGDSTVADRSGWGLGFKQFVDTNKAEVINCALGGRSSMSFMREGHWTNALALHGDYYLIQFGHNNEPGKPGRSTDMPTFIVNMKQYVDDTRAIGAKPILVTPLTRRQWDKNNPGKIKSSLAPYAEDVRQIAAEKHVPLVDLHARSIELCESWGKEKCLEFSPTKVVNGKTVYDGTHLNDKGRVLFARLVVDELRKAAPELSPVLLAEPMNPDPQVVSPEFDEVVAGDGSGTQTNLQAAINAAPDNGGQFRILIKPGIYHGQFIVPKSKHHIQFIGRDAAKTILTYDLNVYETNATTILPFKGTGVIVLGDDFHAKNITFQNTSGDHGQALALRVDGDRAEFRNCRLLGWQDTLMINNGRDYFTNCYIAGRVDFIYGSATTAFDHCEIHSKNGGHVTAASTPQGQPFGFVFLDCNLTGDPTPWVNPTNSTSARPQARMPMADLGRPWRPYASVTYVRCNMGNHIKPDGWNNWGKAENEKTARYTEYKSSGPGANPDARVKWSHQLTDEQAEALTVENILGGSDHWKP